MLGLKNLTGINVIYKTLKVNNSSVDLTFTVTVNFELRSPDLYRIIISGHTLVVLNT